MGFADKFSLKIPYLSWAKDSNIKGGDLDFENWKELQRWADRLEMGALPVIDFGDDVVMTGYSKEFWVENAGTLATVTGTLSVAGSTDTVTEILRSGYTVGTLTIPAGERLATASIDAAFEANDFWQVYQISAGTGAAGATYYGGFT